MSPVTLFYIYFLLFIVVILMFYQVYNLITPKILVNAEGNLDLAKGFAFSTVSAVFFTLGIFLLAMGLNGKCLI